MPIDDRYWYANAAYPIKSRTVRTTGTNPAEIVPAATGKAIHILALDCAVSGNTTLIVKDGDTVPKTLIGGSGRDTRAAAPLSLALGFWGAGASGKNITITSSADVNVDTTILYAEVD